MSPSTCPHCGFDLAALQRFTLGPLAIEADGAVIRWRGKVVNLSQQQRLIVLALARAGGATMRRGALAEVAGHDGDDPENLVAVVVCRIKSRFRAIDPYFDQIENIRGLGIRWAA